MKKMLRWLMVVFVLMSSQAKAMMLVAIVGSAAIMALVAGALTPLTPATISVAYVPSHIATSSDGKNVYITSPSSYLVAQFSRNVTTGVLSALTPATISTGTTYPYGIILSQDGLSLYAADQGVGNTISMFTRDPVTGLLTALTPSTVAMTGGFSELAISQDGTSVYASAYNNNIVSQYSRNTTTGLLTALATVATGANPKTVEISGDRKNVYVVNQGSNSVSQYARDVVTGLLTPLTPSTIGFTCGFASTQASTMTVDGAYLFVTCPTDGTVIEFGRNATSGLLTLLTTVASGAPRYISESPDGMSVYVTDTTSNLIHQFSLLGGVLTAISPATVTTTPNIPTYIRVSTDAAFVYSVDLTSSVILQFKRN